MKLTITAHVSVDGVMHALDAPDDDLRCTRLFGERGQGIAFDLIDSRATPNGVTVEVYRPTGRPQYATAGAER